MYKQCKLEKDGQFQTAWISIKGANLGCSVEIDKVFWNVVEVYNYEVSEKVLREQQKLNRNSLTSIIAW